MSWWTRWFRPDPFAKGLAAYVPPVLPDPEPIPEAPDAMPSARVRAERDKVIGLVKARYGLPDGDAGDVADEVTRKALAMLGRLPEVREREE